MVLELDGIAVTSSHQGTLGASASLIERRRISMTGSRHGMVQLKASKNPGENSILENSERENDFEFEKLGAKIL